MRPEGIELKITGVVDKEKFQNNKFRNFLPLLLKLVNLTTTQVETLFGELEYVDPILRALGISGG